ncbi:sensor histidine kinase [Caulobacter segnis]
MEQTPLDVRQHQFLSSIIDASGSCRRSSHDVLDLAGLEAGGTKIERTPTDIAALVSATTTLVRCRADEKSLRLIVHTQGLPKLADTDGLRLRQVLTNLLANAIKFTQTGFVALNVSWHDGALHCAVQDSGPGFLPADKARLFAAIRTGR